MRFWLTTTSDIMEDATRPVEDIFQNLGEFDYIGLTVVLLLFTFLVFLFFSSHTAFFYVDGELFYKERQVYMTDITPPTPNKEGYRFVEWCRDEELLEPAEIPYNIRLFDVKFYARFEPLDSEPLQLAMDFEKGAVPAAELSSDGEAADAADAAGEAL